MVAAWAMSMSLARSAAYGLAMLRADYRQGAVEALRAAREREVATLLARGLSREQVEEQMEQLRAASEEQAKEQLKTFFIMDKVAEKLDVDVSDEEINGHIAQVAVQRGQRPEKLKEQMERDGSLAQFRLDVRQNKCISKLLESANITEQAPEEKKKSRKSKKAAEEKAERKSE